MWASNDLILTEIILEQQHKTSEKQCIGRGQDYGACLQWQPKQKDAVELWNSDVIFS